MGRSFGIWALLTLGCVVTSAGAAQQTAVSLAEIESQQQRIRAELNAGTGRPGALDTMRRARLRDLQDRVFLLLARARSAGGLGADDQLQLFNDLEGLKAVLGSGDTDDRMVCEREAIVGTRRYQMACMTRSERDRRAESARAAMMERAGCTTRACKGGGPGGGDG